MRDWTGEDSNGEGGEAGVEGPGGVGTEGRTRAGTAVLEEGDAYRCRRCRCPGSGLCETNNCDMTINLHGVIEGGSEVHLPRPTIQRRSGFN